MANNLHKPLRVLAISGIIALALAVAESRGDAPQRPYQAKWIWAKVQATEPFQFVRFRKTFDLDAGAGESDGVCHRGYVLPAVDQRRTRDAWPCPERPGQDHGGPGGREAILEARWKHRGRAGVSRTMSF